MGKSGKERKRQKLLNVQLLANQGDTDGDSDTETSSEILTSENLATTIGVLDALSSNITSFRSPQMKGFRTAIGPLVTEQRDKHFERRKLPQLSADQLSQVLNEESLSTAIVVLSHLCTDLNTFRSKEFKAFRSSFHPLVMELTGNKNNNNTSKESQVVNANIPTGGYSGRISAHFIANEWIEALKELHLMYKAKQAPKLGALQRWTRDADLAPTELRYPLIDAVLRVVENTSTSYLSDKILPEKVDIELLTKYPKALEKSLFVIPPCDSNANNITLPLGKFEPSHLRIVHTQHAIDRPSKTDLNMFTIPAESFTLASLPPTSSRSISVPGVHGGFVIPHILSHQECDQWLHIASTMTFAPDTVAGINHVLWLAQKPLIDSLYERVKPHLPPIIDNCALAGINARLRFFRYEPGAEYRIHIDGAWPGSGFDASGQPVDDIFGDRYSRLTFLIYLNDGFEGGHTTFFTPSRTEIGLLESSAVKPSKGSILCFPHGDAVGSLAHEGTSVIEGLKYVIRTDVLYMLPTNSNTNGQKRKHT